MIRFKPDLGIFTHITDFEFDQIDTRLKGNFISSTLA